MYVCSIVAAANLGYLISLKRDYNVELTTFLFLVVNWQNYLQVLTCFRGEESFTLLRKIQMKIKWSSFSPTQNILSFNDTCFMQVTPPHPRAYCVLRSVKTAYVCTFLLRTVYNYKHNVFIVHNQSKQIENTVRCTQRSTSVPSTVAFCVKNIFLIGRSKHIILSLIRD